MFKASCRSSVGAHTLHSFYFPWSVSLAVCAAGYHSGGLRNVGAGDVDGCSPRPSVTVLLGGGLLIHGYPHCYGTPNVLHSLKQPELQTETVNRPVAVSWAFSLCDVIRASQIVGKNLK